MVEKSDSLDAATAATEGIMTDIEATMLDALPCKKCGSTKLYLIETTENAGACGDPDCCGVEWTGYAVECECGNRECFGERSESEAIEEWNEAQK